MNYRHSKACRAICDSCARSLWSRGRALASCYCGANANTNASGGRSGVQGNISRAILNNLGVFRNVLCTYTNEVLQSFFGLFIGTTPSGDAVNNILGEIRVDAVAALVSVAKNQRLGHVGAIDWTEKLTLYTAS